MVRSVIAEGVPIGLGSYVQWDRKLDGRLAQAHHVDPGDQSGGDRHRTGSRGSPGLASPDEIVLDAGGPLPVGRPTNNAGGLEGASPTGRPFAPPPG